ncbi:MAG: sulfotransferase family 2 domain-containing protein [Thermodesulfovibrionia bacterium]|nr:sulfotransferase family 2 domain-containing protein [Thermodesulfovibrionia bacterium]
MERTVIIHCHIFKNAGTIFDRSLERNFGQAFFVHRDDEKMKKGAEYLGPFLHEHTYIKALSSHHIRFPLPDVSNTRLLPTLIIRHPVDRVGSVYLFERKQDAQTPEAINIRKMSFQNYVLWRMKPTNEGIIRNFQTRYCLDEQSEVLNEENYKIAQKRIRETHLLGLVDYYDESMVLFEEVLRPYYPDINLAYIKENVTLGGERGLEQRVNAIFQSLSIEIIDILFANNQWDLMLYLEAKSIIKERMANTPYFTDKLNDFYQRCLALRNRRHYKRI